MWVVLGAAWVQSPHAAAQAPGQRSAVPAQDCDRQCLIGILRQYMGALARRDVSGLPVAPGLRYTENNVELPHGSAGIWATATGVAATGLEAADSLQGEVAWIGAVDEHGAPVYFGLRLQVRDRRITEAEAVVVRNSGLPLPWGDFGKLVHDPAFNEVLPEASRRPRERLRAVADSYFNTVELNDGMVFAPFHAECGRIENGIHTTAAGASAAGNAASISPGCEAQFKLGIYYINKRVRERRYPIIDEERGVVVATGFFDHANGFDRYRLTDGREMRTALKWPNSISLVEAFKIVDGRIYRIETVFSYVPYFMPNPFFLHPEPPPARLSLPQRRQAGCDEHCLRAAGDRFMTALAGRRPQDIAWAEVVGYTENGVRMAVGDGLWASIRRKSDEALVVADPVLGSYTWYGLVYDHDAPAYAGIRLRVVDGKVSEVEVLVARERNPGPWLAPAQFALDARLAAAGAAGSRLNRAALVRVVDSHARALEGRGPAGLPRFSTECQRRENGQIVTAGAAGPAVLVRWVGELAPGCSAPLQQGFYQPLEALRDRRVVAVDPQRGLVVSISQADFPLRETRYRTRDGVERETAVRYPVTRSLFEVHRVEQGAITRMDAVSVFQPYGMASGW
jgi:hypothetical protein